jgi:hypothetical protein
MARRLTVDSRRAGRRDLDMCGIPIEALVERRAVVVRSR